MWYIHQIKVNPLSHLFYFWCILDIDECLDRTSCGREAQCRNAPGTFQCTCPNGEPFNSITRSCSSSVICTNNDNCPGNAICSNGACNCPDPNVGPDCEGMFLRHDIGVENLLFKYSDIHYNGIYNLKLHFQTLAIRLRAFQTPNVLFKMLSLCADVHQVFNYYPYEERVLT